MPFMPTPLSSLTFVRCTRGKLCPICGHDAWCSTTVEGPVWCMRADRDGLSVKGYRRTRKVSDDGGRLFVPDGFAWTAASPEKLREREEKARLFAERSREKARGIWNRAVKAEYPAGWPVAAYLASRGVDVSMLPGGAVPACLRFGARVADVFTKNEGPNAKGGVWSYSPAMVAAVRGADGKGRGVHRTYLEVDQQARTAVKRAEDAKKQLGPCTGGSVRLHTPEGAKVLVLAEGIETALACLVALRGNHATTAVWSCMDGQKLSAVELPAGVAKGLHTVVIAADLDRNGVGAKYAALCANVLRTAWPWLTVVVKFPSAAVCPSLVEAVEGEEKPTEAGGKGVDWLDVLKVSGEEGVRAGLVDAVPFAKHAERARMITDVQAVGADTSGGEGTGSSGGPGDEGGGGYGGGGGGDGGGDDGGHAGGEDGDRGEDRRMPVYVGVGVDGPTQGMWWADGFNKPCLADGPLERARLFLMQKCDVGVGKGGGGGRYGLAFWGGKFFRYRVKAHKWEPMEQSDRDGAPVELFAEVQEWLGGFLRERVLQNGAKYEPVDTGSHAVGEVVKSLRGQCLVRGSSMPCWLPRQRDEKGRPVWAGVGVEDGRGGVGKVERHAATDYIVFANGVLWVRGLLEERPVELLPHDPMLFTQAVRPYELDVGALAEALTDGCSDALMQRLCPAFWQFLGDICESPTKEEGEAKRANLQRMFGDAVGADRSIEKICLVPGPRRAGKGTLFAALMSVVRREAVAVTSFYALGGDRFGLAPLVGASVAVLPDAHVAGLSDGTLAVEVLKTISGNDPVSVRDLYSPAQPNVQMGVRFWIFCNDPPEKLLDNSGALASRFVVWPMVRSFESVQDPRVKQRVATEGAGIAVWALVGWRDLWSMQVPMLASSEDGEAIRQEMMYMSSPLTRYVDDRLSTGQGLSVELGELHEDYVRWCEANGHDHPVGRNKLSTRLMTLVHGMRVVRRPKPENKSQKMTVLCGLHIRPDAEHIPGPAIPVSSDPQDDLQSWLRGRG